MSDLEGEDDANKVSSQLYRKLDAEATSYLLCFKCGGPLIEGKQVLFCRICDIVYELKSAYAHGKLSSKESKPTTLREPK